MGLATFFRNQFLILSIFIFHFHHSYAEPYKYDLAVCAIFQNEASYLREWIEFHKLVGVKHFYLYNNRSNDKYYQVLKPYIQSGEVELIQWNYKTKSDGSNWSSIQNKAYKHAIKSSKDVVKWLAIIDTDEFIFPVEMDSLSEFLLDYDDEVALCVNWQMYGTSGVKEILEGHLMIEDLVYKAPEEHVENKHIKSIVRPEYVTAVNNPHFCEFLPGFYQVNADKEPFVGPFSEVHIDKVRINHYWTRDEGFFYHVKIPRRQKWGDSVYIERANNINRVVDEAIFKYVPKLKEKMGFKK